MLERWFAAPSVQGLAQGERRGFVGDKSYSQPGRQDSFECSANGTPWGRGGFAGRSWTRSGLAGGTDGEDVAGIAGIAGIACEAIGYVGLSRRLSLLCTARSEVRRTGLR